MKKQQSKTKPVTKKAEERKVTAEELQQIQQLDQQHQKVQTSAFQVFAEQMRLNAIKQQVERDVQKVAEHRSRLSEKLNFKYGDVQINNSTGQITQSDEKDK